MTTEKGSGAVREVGQHLRLKFEPIPTYAESAKILGKEYPEHETYFRENNGDWIIATEDGERFGTVSFRASAKRGHAYHAPDPEGMERAKALVRRWNSHSELLEALEHLLEIFEVAPSGWILRDVSSISPKLAYAKEVIGRAKGESR